MVWISISASQTFQEIFQPKTKIALGTKNLQGKVKCLKGGVGLSLLRSHCLVSSSNALLNVHHDHVNSCLSVNTDGIHSPRNSLELKTPPAQCYLGTGYLGQFLLACAAGLSEPSPHNRLFCGQLSSSSNCVHTMLMLVRKKLNKKVLIL